jgi:EAL domain-containing protein (putative c-di-GMP-specific phosphodiesterase class I)
VPLALDDFGVGQSSPAMLKRLPIQQIKLDRGVAQGMAGDERDRALVAAVLLPLWAADWATAVTP